MQCRRPGFDPWEDPLQKEMATHSSLLAWETPWTEEPGGLQSIEFQELDTTKVTEQINVTISQRPPMATLFNVVILYKGVKLFFSLASTRVSHLKKKSIK